MVDPAEATAHLAHVRQDEDGHWYIHPLAEHLRGTATRSGSFARSFGSEDWAFLAGLWHDLGKYSAEFQARIKTKSGYDPDAHLEAEGSIEKVDHSTAGAIHATERLGPTGRILAYLIAGHHAGLPDWTREIGSGGPLSERLSDLTHLDRALQGGASESILQGEPITTRPAIAPEHFHLWVRVLFSCLVDADFLDTEAFMNPEKADQRGASSDLADLKERFDIHMDTKAAGSPDTPVNRLRQQVLAECRVGGIHQPGLFSLTVPTGGGKTLASMAFALDHALRHGKRRIVVVIPYTSIIEQTAQVLREAFGDPAVVLEHHCNLDLDRLTVAGRLAAENWDAPIIVTTNVQFFESLFAARTSACRKLHNLVDSVVIFDEAQMLPPGYLRPILGAIQGLTQHFGVTSLLCTATQPALEGRIGSQKAAFQGLAGVKELVSDPTDLAGQLKRVELRSHKPDLSVTEWPDLAHELSTRDQVLCIVNTRKDCRELHALMPEGTIHLSALMCAEHRTDVIAKIKGHLTAGASVRVISTQLVEAGVDMDFPVVYRALAGLDSMAQAAGRCNREGRLNYEGRLGEVVLFAPPKPAPPGLLRKGEEAGKEMLRCHPGAVARLTPDGFRRYFELFYSKVNSFDEKDMNGLLEKDASSGQFQFRTAASRFHLIDDEAQQSIVVWYPLRKAAIQKLLDEMRMIGPSMGRIRKLQRFTVTLRERDFKKLADRGDVLDYGGIWGQAVDGLYDPVLGLCPDGVAWNPETYIQ